MRMPAVTAVAAAAFVVIFAVAVGYGGAFGAATPPTGWLEGAVQYEDGRGAPFVQVRLLQNGRVVTSTGTSYEQGGFYSLRDLKPGIYEVRASGDLSADIRAMRVWGVVVRPDTRTKLDITAEKGMRRPMQEIGQPTVETTPVIPLSHKLAHLQAQIDQLKKR